MEDPSLVIKDSESEKLFPLNQRSVLSWKFVGIIAFVVCLIIATYQVYFEKNSDMLLIYVLYPVSIALLALLVYTKKILKCVEAKLMGAYLAWIIIVLFLNNYRVSNALSSTWFYCTCVTSFICFGLPYAFSSNEIDRLVRIIAAVTVISVTTLCTIGLISVFTGWVPPIAIIEQGQFGIMNDGRLHLIWHPNSIAPMCGIAILVSILLLKREKRWLSKMFLSTSLIICYLALALTDSRAGILSLCIALFLVFFLYSNVILNKVRKSIYRITLSVALGLVCVFLVFIGTSVVHKAVSYLLSARAVITISADSSIEAETQPQTDSLSNDKPEKINNPDDSMNIASTRGLSDFSTFNGRIDIWAGVIRGLKEHPDILITGTTPLKSGEIIGPYFPANAPAGNIHNSYLGVLVSFGAPGLAILVIFLVMLAKASIRLSFTKLTNKKTLEVRIIPAILLLTLAEGMMEVFLFVEWSLNYVWIWFLFSAAIVFRISRNKDHMA